MTLVPTVISVALATLLAAYAIVQSGQPLDDEAVVSSALVFRNAARQYRDEHCTTLSTQTGTELGAAGYLLPDLLRPDAASWSVSFNGVGQGLVTLTTTDRRVGVVLRELGAMRTSTSVEFSLMLNRGLAALGSRGFIAEAGSGGGCGG